MKEGTRYAERLRKVYAKLQKSPPDLNVVELRDPVRCLAVGILGTDFGEELGERQLNRAFSTMVDWNELRVSNASELSEAVGDVSPESMRRCRNLIDAIQAIYDRENKVSLERLKTIGRREARTYLETLKGVDEFAVAVVVLWSLGGHAIPVSQQLLEELRDANLVNPTATREEVQAFMERNVAASEAMEFCVVMRSFAAAKRSSNRRTVTRKAGTRGEGEK